MDRLLTKQRLLTGYLEALLIKHFPETSEHGGMKARIITPADPTQRGCQLSVSFSHSLERIHEELSRQGVVVS